jgi:DNA processing protein
MTAPPARRLSDAERLAALRLIRSEGVGPATYGELLARFRKPSAALAALPDLARRAGRRIAVCGETEARRELEATAAEGAVLAVAGEPEYPPLLAAVEGAPPLLAVRGDPACLAKPAVAIVGSRNASVAGRKLAMAIAAGLGEAGFTIVSGLAIGIDAAAHRASLATGTAAVLAGGLDQLYPPQNLDLAAEILDAGGVHVSEMPLGTQPRGRDFPRRNRIISGMALGVVVVEAARRSGSLVTAHRAADQGRPVFAVPGSPLDPRAEGTNELIRDGATLVRDAADVIADLAPLAGRLRTAAGPTPIAGVSEDGGSEQPLAVDADEADRDRVIDALGTAPVSVDDLVRFTGLAAAVVQLVLLELDLAGRLERHRGQRVSLI